MRKKEKPKCYQLYLAYYLFSCHTLYAWCSYSSQYRVNTHVYVVSTSRLPTIFNVIFYIHSLCVFAQWEFDFKWKFTQIIYKLYTNTHTYMHIYTHIHIHTYIYIYLNVVQFVAIANFLTFCISKTKIKNQKVTKKPKLGKMEKEKTKTKSILKLRFSFSHSLSKVVHIAYIYIKYTYIWNNLVNRELYLSELLLCFMCMNIILYIIIEIFFDKYKCIFFSFV